MSFEQFDDPPISSIIEDFKPYAKNPRKITDKQLDQLEDTLKRFGDLSGVIVHAHTKEIIGGNQRTKVFNKHREHCKIELVAIHDIPDAQGTIAYGYIEFLGHKFNYREVVWNEAMVQEANIVANKGGGEWDFEILSKEFKIEDLLNWGFEEEELKAMPEFDAQFAEMGQSESISKEQSIQTLAERFIVPPFSVLDTRQGYWMERKRAWLGLGIESEVGRGDNLAFSRSAQNTEVYELRNEMRAKLKREASWDEIEAEAKKQGITWSNGTSIFDPVLCELMYKWFCTEGGKILDPFAGGSVRGIVAARLGYQYVGIELREEQTDSNRVQAEKILAEDIKNSPMWFQGDSNDLVKDMPPDQFDFIFSCPPYHDLEVYSDDKNDLSTMSDEEFSKIYAQIITAAVSKLKNNRFACFVVTELRNKAGYYKGFVNETIEAFEKAGALFYNDIILLNQFGSLPIRVGRQFSNGRKVGRTHQNVLVFYKGDTKEIKNNSAAIKIEELIAEGLQDKIGQPNIAS